MKKTMALLLLVLIAKLSVAQQNVLTPYSLLDLKMVAEVSVSPDNKFIAYTLIIPRQLDEVAGGDYRDLYVYDVGKKTSSVLISNKRIIHTIGWTPDAKNIVFKAVLPDIRGTQLYSIAPTGGDINPVTKHPEGIMNYEFFNNTLLYFTALAPQNETKADLVKRGFDMEIYEEEYRDINLYEFNIRDNTTRQLSFNVTVHDFSIASNGKYAVATVAEKNLVDYSYMFKRIHSIDLVSLKMEKILDNPGKLGNVKWSPDAKRIAFKASSHLNDAVEGSLFVIDFPNNKSFNELDNLVKGFRGSVIDFSWKDNNTLYFAAEEGVDISLSEYDLRNKRRILTVDPGKIVFRTYTHTPTTIAFAANTSQHPNEVFMFNVKRKELSRLTNNNPFLDKTALSKQEKIVYHARDGLDIEGVLIYPLNYEKGKKYPMIVYIHGGPEAAVQNGWLSHYSRWGQVAAAKGFFLFYPNYRASSGRGVDFTMAGFGDLLGVEFNDVLDGVDHLIKTGMVDKDRVGIGGGSYGGYFAAWGATKHTERFAASVVFVGVSNQISKRNTTDIPWEDYLVHWGSWSHENWEKVFEVSPVKYAHKSKTPTLILHGKDDPRVHVSQGLELYRALKIHGEAPVRLVLYPGEGHGNRKNTSRLDYMIRTIEWFDYYLNSNQPKDKMPEKYFEIN